MNLTLTNDMTINYLHNGVSVVLDQIIYQHGQISDIVYQRGSGPTPPAPIDYSKEYFTVTSWEDNNTLSFLHSNSSKNMLISFDKTNWTDIINGTSGTYTYTLNRGEKAYFKGINNTLTDINDRQSCWWGSKLYEFSGNIMSLLYGDNFIGQTTVPNTSSSKVFAWAFTPASQSDANILTMRNLIIPVTTYSAGIFKFTFAYLPKLIYLPKEFEAETSMGSYPFEGAFEHSPKVQESPIFKLTTSGVNYYFNGVSLKRFIALCSSGYPTIGTSGAQAQIKYKLSTNTTSGTYRDFDTLQANNSFISVWAEAEVPYTGYIEGCSDYFVAGDTVTLTATPLTGYTFAGYYDGDTLVSSNATYTFTASESKNLIAKFN